MKTIKVYETVWSSIVERPFGINAGEKEVVSQRYHIVREDDLKPGWTQTPATEMTGLIQEAAEIGISEMEMYNYPHDFEEVFFEIVPTEKVGELEMVKSNSSNEFFWDKDGTKYISVLDAPIFFRRDTPDASKIKENFYE